jgi:hypothetical protein
MEEISLICLENDIDKKNVDDFIQHFKLYIFQKDQSRVEFSAIRFLSNLSKNENEFCSLLATSLFHTLKYEDSVLEYIYAVCFHVGCGVEQNFS